MPAPVNGVVSTGLAGGTFTTLASGDDGHFLNADESVMMGTASSPTSYDSVVNNTSTITVGAIEDADNMEYDWYKAYYRFSDITVAKEATIDSAYFKPFVNGGTGSVTFTLAAHDVDSASAPSSAGDGAHSNHTSATVAWSNPSTSAGQLTSPDIKTIIQELVNRGGWSSGNEVLIVMWLASISAGTDGTRLFDSHQTSSGSKKAQLVITVGED